MRLGRIRGNVMPKDVPEIREVEMGEGKMPEQNNAQQHENDKCRRRQQESRLSRIAQLNRRSDHRFKLRLMQLSLFGLGRLTRFGRLCGGLLMANRLCLNSAALSTNGRKQQ